MNRLFSLFIFAFVLFSCNTTDDSLNASSYPEGSWILKERNELAHFMLDPDTGFPVTNTLTNLYHTDAIQFNSDFSEMYYKPYPSNNNNVLTGVVSEIDNSGCKVTFENYNLECLFVHPDTILTILHMADPVCGGVTLKDTYTKDNS